MALDTDNLLDLGSLTDPETPELLETDLATTLDLEESATHWDPGEINTDTPTSAVSLNRYAAIENAPITVGTDLQLEALATDTTTRADAASTNGDASALADNTLGGGLIDSPVYTGLALGLTARQGGSVDSSANTTNGRAQATSLMGSERPLGSILSSPLTTGTDMTLQSSGINSGAASARTVDGLAEANGVLSGSFGLLESNLVAGSSLSASFNLRNDLSSSAQTVSGPRGDAADGHADEDPESGPQGLSAGDPEQGHQDEPESGVAPDHGVDHGADQELAFGLAAIAQTRRGELSGVSTESISAGTDLAMSTSVGHSGSTQASPFAAGWVLQGNDAVANRATSEAFAVSGSAEALTQIARNTGISTNRVFSGANGSLNAGVANQLQALAETVSGDSTAQLQTDVTLGLSIGDLTVGQNAVVSGKVHNQYPGNTAVPVAQAVSISGDATAEATNQLMAGMDLGLSRVGRNGNFTGSARNIQSSVAQTTTGEAEALAGVNALYGIRVGADGEAPDEGDLAPLSEHDHEALAVPLFIGEAGRVDADADARGGATANTTTGDALAQVDQPLVVGFQSPVLQTGTDLEFDADAINFQRVTATATSGSAQALTSRAGNFTAGVNQSVLTIGQDATGLGASALLDSNATASAVSGDASTQAEAPELGGMDADEVDAHEEEHAGGELDGFTAGIVDSAIRVGRNATNGLRFDATSRTVGTAETVTGDASASLSNEVYGAVDTPLVVGDSILNGSGGTGTANFIANGSSSTTAAAITGAALANTALAGTGFYGGTAKIGRNGNINAASVINGSATADQVTAPSLDPSDHDDYHEGAIGDEPTSRANLVLLSSGLTPGVSDEHGRSISIGNSGNVVGQSLSSGTSTANGINGAVEALSLAQGRGIDLSGDLVIGNTGSVVGRSFVGKWNEQPGGYGVPATADQLQTLANTTTGNAAAASAIDSVGLDGDEGLSVVAGPRGGGIEGRGLAAANTSANTITGEASAANTAEIIGIHNLDLYGGQAGAASNLVLGQAKGAFNTSAMATTGDAVGVSSVNGGGIIGDNNVLRVNGNVSAIADYSNTVMATTVTGLAIARALTNAVGISGYQINLLESGNISANVSTSSIANAQNVSGGAYAYAN